MGCVCGLRLKIEMQILPPYVWYACVVLTDLFCEKEAKKIIFSNKL